MRRVAIKESPLGLFPKGDCWNGGGLFTDKAAYWLNDGCGHSELRNTHELQRDLKFKPSSYFGGECPGIYYPRLMRDGWDYIERRGTKGQEMDIFEKPLREGWILRKLAHSEVGAPPGKGCYWNEHELFRPSSDKLIKCTAWEWAELDEKRLVWSTEGRLYAARIRAAGLIDESELFDFNKLSYERIEAPY